MVVIRAAAKPWPTSKAPAFGTYVQIVVVQIDQFEAGVRFVGDGHGADSSMK